MKLRKQSIFSPVQHSQMTTHSHITDEPDGVPESHIVTHKRAHTLTRATRSLAETHAAKQEYYSLDDDGSGRGGETATDTGPTHLGMFHSWPPQLNATVGTESQGKE
jgi:hypothetical protein